MLVFGETLNRQRELESMQDTGKIISKVSSNMGQQPVPLTGRLRDKQSINQ